MKFPTGAKIGNIKLNTIAYRLFFCHQKTFLAQDPIYCLFSAPTNQSEGFCRLTNDTMSLDIGRRNPSYNKCRVGSFLSCPGNQSNYLTILMFHQARLFCSMIFYSPCILSKIKLIYLSPLRRYSITNINYPV